ncbi:TPA: Lrp/AsnC family transcriptional regulator [Candidatus Woesearchaeota archaeon]|nr:Lrp/AsnC family transcriptional regulator [Candidatus Woesearchaeota archaeon]
MGAELDAKDKKILSELDMDARQSISSIAKKVGLSKEVVNYRIKQLEKRGVITGYYTVLNVAKLGLMFCRFFSRVQNVNLEKEKEIYEFAKQYPEVCWVVSTKGPWDLAFVILVNKINEFKRICDTFSFKYGSHFQERYVSIATKIHHMKHKYLYDTNRDEDKILGGDAEEETIDDTDYKILSIIATDARMSTLDIARKLKITPNTVKYRIKKLVEKNIILCFRAAIGIKELGYQRHKVILTLQNMTEKKTRRMIEFLKQNKNVTYITESVGCGDVEFEIDVRGSNELHENLNAIRHEFGELIRNYDICVTYSEEQVNYLPLKNSAANIPSKTQPIDIEES